MKTALVLTTINVPRVLALYRAYGPDVHFFVCGDRRSDDLAITNFLIDIPNHSYYGIDLQHSLYPKLSHLIGENCIQRRNIGTLEALKWGADVIVFIDDDNIPLGNAYFEFFHTAPLNSFGHQRARFNGLKATSPSGWFDVGRLLVSDDDGWSEHRGFPHTKRAQPAFEAITDAKIGVAAGICMGDPDVSAVERIANGPTVHGVSEILRSGVVTDPAETWTVFNSQNTAFIRELAPAMFMFPATGRHDDIYASIVTQTVMREKRLCVHFGKPFVYQQRNLHDLLKDLRQEIDGMEHIVHLAAICEGTRFFADEHLVRTIFKKLAAIEWFPKRAIEAALAWMDEIEKIL